MGFRDDIRGVPDDVRAAARDFEGSLQETAERRPLIGYLLDVRIVLVAALGAFLIALILRLLGLSFLLSVLVFLLLLIGLWLVIAGAAAPRPPTARASVKEGAQPGAGVAEAGDEDE
jgi:Flp pilus assembly protein TadB